MNAEIDIVDRLRAKPPIYDDAKAAADEIVRLRIMIKKLNTQLYFYRTFNQKREEGKL
jgi:hypothetical protein